MDVQIKSEYTVHNISLSLLAPCRPTNVQTLSDCQSDNLTISWDVAAGAESYLVEVYGNYGDEYNCTTTGNTCIVAGVPCGGHLTMWVTASTGECSNRVLGQAAVTGRNWKI